MLLTSMLEAVILGGLDASGNDKFIINHITLIFKGHIFNSREKHVLTLADL